MGDSRWSKDIFPVGSPQSQLAYEGGVWWGGSMQAIALPAGIGVYMHDSIPVSVGTTCIPTGHFRMGNVILKNLKDFGRVNRLKFLTLIWQDLVESV
jgi:hypothetical protein